MQPATRDQLRRSGLPLIGALWVFGFVTGNWRNGLLADGDTYWHLAIGNWMLAHHQVPYRDLFSYTFAGAPFTAHEWLSELVMAVAYDAGGWTGLVALFAAVAALTIYLLAADLGRFMGVIAASVLVALAGFGIMVGLLARPHILALPLTEIWIAGLIVARARSQAPSWTLIPVMLLWANLHGSFMIGLALTGALGFEAIVAVPARQRRKVAKDWALFLLAAIAAALATPNFITGFLLPFRFQFMDIMFTTVREWRSPNFQYIDPLEILLMTAMLFGFWRGIRLPIFRLILVLGLVHEALQHVRNEVIVGLVSVLLMAEALGRQLRARPFRLAGRSAGFELAVGAPAALVLIGLLVLKPITRGDDAVTPQSALAALPEALKARPVFNEYSFGGYLIFRGLKPFIDGRTDMYGGAFLKTYTDAASGDRAKLDAVLKRYDIAWSILPPGSAGVAAFDSEPGWRRLYADDVAVVHVRDDAIARP